VLQEDEDEWRGRDERGFRDCAMKERGGGQTAGRPQTKV